MLHVGFQEPIMVHLNNKKDILFTITFRNVGSWNFFFFFFSLLSSPRLYLFHQTYNKTDHI